MRTAALAGLLAAALVTLSLDRHPLNATEVPVHTALDAETVDSIKSTLFAAQRNLEIERAMRRSALARERTFVAARSREINASLAASAKARPTLVAEARAAELKAFAAARNAEIAASMARVQAGTSLATLRPAAPNLIETGSIGSDVPGCR